MKNLIVIMNNSVSSVSGQNRNNFKFFSGGPEEKEIRVRRAGQLAAAGAAANCDASERCSIPPSVLRQARRGRDSASAGGYRAVGASLPSACQPRQRRAKCEAASISCPGHWSTRSDSGAGAARALAGRAQEVFFPVPASRASFNSAGASERSACQPRQRLAKGDAASIRCGIPLNQENDIKRPGDNLRGRKFYGFSYEALDNDNFMTIEEKSKGIRNKINEFRPCIFRKQSGRIIARNFGRINCCFCGSEGKKGGPGGIGSINGHGAEAVLNRGIIAHGKFCNKILLIPGGVGRYAASYPREAARTPTRRPIGGPAAVVPCLPHEGF